MPQLVRWHMGVGELALRLFVLHLLWLLGTVAGAVVLGILPATAALCTVLRGDQLDRALEERGDQAPRRDGLWTCFWSAWREQFWSAHRLGAALLLGWLVLSLDRWVLSDAQLGTQLSITTGPVVSGLIVVLTVMLALLTVLVWPLRAHFSDSLPRILRMGLVLLVRRPSISLSLALVLAGSVWFAQTVPGLVPVFGLALPAWVVTALLWRSGAMPLTTPADAAPPE